MDPLHWLEQQPSDVPPGHDWLSPRELAVLSDMRFTRRRSSWRLGRWTAKRAIVSRLGGVLSPADVEIVAASDGAPESYVFGRPSPVRASISHCDTSSLCALAPRGVLVGCDVETVEERGPMFARDYFTHSELRRVLREKGESRALAETLVWSAKEAALKAIREGLRRDTRDVVVDVGDLEGLREWEPIGVALADGTCPLFGWWRRRGDLVYTVVSARPCSAPEMLTRSEALLT